MNDLKIVKLNKFSNIYIKKTKKFKSIAISISYKMKYNYKNVTAFNILAKYLGNSNNNYKSIEQFNKYVDSLYGTSFGIKSDYTGSLFTFTLFANYINPSFVNDDSLNEKVIKLLSDCVYNPMIENNVFNEELFNICKENCLIDIESLDEYNMRYIIRKLNSMLTNDVHSSFSMPSLGDKKTIKSLNVDNLYKYYKKLLNAPFDIYITGDVKYKDIISLIKKYYKKIKVKKVSYDVFSQIDNKTLEPLIIKKKVNQSKVAIAYQIPVLFNNDKHYSFRIARLILSGTLSSKFYKVIREQMGLCYSISSNYSSYNGVFTINTGVDSNNIDTVVKEVDNQIKQLQNGNITDEEYSQAKQSILSDMYSVNDSIFGVLDMIKTYSYFNKEFDYNK